MRWTVRFQRKPNMSVEVEGEDRWSAVVAAVRELGLDQEDSTLSTLFAEASVRKLERKKRLAWWEKEPEVKQEDKDGG